MSLHLVIVTHVLLPCLLLLLQFCPLLQSPVGCYIGLVCFWDLVEETMVHQLQAHKSAVCSVAMHPEAKCLVTGSNDGTAKVWQPPAAT